MKFILFIGLIMPFFPSAKSLTDSILMIPPHTLPWDNAIINTDSLELELQKMTGSEKIINLCKLSLGLMKSKSDYEASKDRALEALEFSEKTGYANGLATAYYLLSGYSMNIEKDIRNNHKIIINNIKIPYK